MSPGVFIAMPSPRPPTLRLAHAAGPRPLTPSQQTSAGMNGSPSAEQNGKRSIGYQPLPMRRHAGIGLQTAMAAQRGSALQRELLTLIHPQSGAQLPTAEALNFICMSFGCTTAWMRKGQMTS